ncbi:MAG: class A beta-lactamase-related serine hydrolase, partial [Chloroflexota bacterium]|nr:class A beta-lactamase-related serine hydrolase [Chloroflexota bacterium]
DVPGLVTLISRRGETHVDALGMMAVGGRDPMRRDTIFRISSMTKPITAAAAMILVEECTLRLDEPVDRLLPELAARRVLTRIDGPVDDTVPATRPITVRDLLTFRMGFGLVVELPDTYPIQRAIRERLENQGPPNPSAAPGPDEWMRRLGTLPLMHQPGEKWLYNTGSDVLGVLIARASGQPLDTFLRERLFEPLGMKDTAFSVPAAALDRLATGYGVNPDTGALTLNDEPKGGQWSQPPAFPSGAGGLVSTVDDYLAFGQMMLNKGMHEDTRILSRPLLPTEADFSAWHASFQRNAPDPTAFDALPVKVNKMLTEWKGWSQAELRAVRAPVLLVIGDHDFVRIEHAAEMARLIPNAQLAVLPGTTHMTILKRGAWIEPMFEARLGASARPGLPY